MCWDMFGNVGNVWECLGMFVDVGNVWECLGMFGDLGMFGNVLYLNAMHG